MPGLKIVGSGHHVPGRPFTNHDLARVMDTSDEWIKPRSGISQRHFAADGEGVSDLAVPAAKKALEDAGLTIDDIDYVVFGTMTPEHMFPGSGGVFAAKMGGKDIPALDIRQQCAFFPYAVQVADALLTAGVAETLLVVAANAHAGFMPWDWDALESGAKSDGAAYDFATEHRSTAVLFGDGAGALVCRRHERADEGYGLIAAAVHSDGDRHDHIYIPTGGFSQRRYWEVDPMSQLPSMKGRELFKQAVTRLPAVVREVCEKASVTLDDVDWFLAHQANDRINAKVMGVLGVPLEKAPSNIAHFGNTSDATIPILIDDMRRQGRLKGGQLVCFLGLGAGLNWGAALLRV